MKKYNIVVAIMLTFALLFTQAGWQMGKAATLTQQEQDYKAMMMHKEMAKSVKVVTYGVYMNSPYYTYYFTFEDGRERTYNEEYHAQTEWEKTQRLEMYKEMYDNMYESQMKEYEKLKAEYEAKYGPIE